MGRGEEKSAELEAQGWRYDHTASCRDYRKAGSVSPMESKDGFEFCRVHCGRVIGGKRNHVYQDTYVMKRKEVKE